MDPLTLLAAAKVSFDALKAGIAVGKELQGMAKDLGSLFDSVAAITRAAADPKGSLIAGKSAQQMAMEAYAAKAEADQMMEELKNHFIGEFGLAAWDQVLSHTTQIKKDMKAAALEAEKAQAEFMNNVLVWGSAILTIVVVVACLLLVAIGLVHR
jgi:CHASE3 domain sensor protein